MSKRSRDNSRLVYSTDGGRLCPQCHRPVAECVCGKDRPAATGDGIVRLQRETAKRLDPRLRALCLQENASRADEGEMERRAKHVAPLFHQLAFHVMHELRANTRALKVYVYGNQV